MYGINKTRTLFRVYIDVELHARSFTAPKHPMIRLILTPEITR